ncbi:nitroreductase family protein [Anaerosinus gibii]|uniref:Nitroreductase family protein n=1 Tax=Selenobaculum gibii TaxID=3054208 RepID=A0A9Y2EUB7_9FIRM|nr:nitroreductase family protein [Selenobaculum gbiensis]WIW71525.1 nitroreductase family protein [Selenobaculum gbiensis]
MSDCIRIDKAACIGCGMCVKDCPHHAIVLKDKIAEMKLDRCMECGHCVAVCPKAAVSMNGYAMDEVKEYDRDTFTIAPETFLNNIKFRRSIRHYKNMPVEHEKIMQIIDAGRYTPTGSNKQRIRYVVAEHPEDNIEKDAIITFRKIKSVTDVVGKFIKLPIDTRKYQVDKGFFFQGAPTAIFVISDDTVDAALASTNMGTMAESLGLGVLYVGFFVRAARINKTIRKKLSITGKERLVTAIAIGYPDAHYKRTVPRKPAKVQWL